MAAGSFGDDLSEAGFADAGRSVEDNGTEPIRFNGSPQQFSWTEDVLLPDKFVQRLWSHPSRQRSVSLDRIGAGRACVGKKIVHRKISRIYG